MEFEVEVTDTRSDVEVYLPTSETFEIATGLPGPPGAPGAPGADGLQGIPGIQGIKGDQGLRGPGIQTGGTSGQFLIKTDGTDYNTQWSGSITTTNGTSLNVGSGASGGLSFGNTKFYQSASGVIRTDTNFYVGSGLTVGGSATVGSTLSVTGNATAGRIGVGVTPIVPLEIRSTSSPQAIIGGVNSSGSAVSQLKIGGHYQYANPSASVVEVYDYTDNIEAATPTNYSRLQFGFNSYGNPAVYDAQVSTDALGTGTRRALSLQPVNGVLKLGGSGTAIGFYGTSGTTRPVITGSRGGNAALASLLTALTTLGLVTDSTTA